MSAPKTGITRQLPRVTVWQDLLIYNVCVQIAMRNCVKKSHGKVAILVKYPKACNWYFHTIDNVTIPTLLLLALPLHTYIYDLCPRSGRNHISYFSYCSLTLRSNILVQQFSIWHFPRTVKTFCAFSKWFHDFRNLRITTYIILDILFLFNILIALKT